MQSSPIILVLFVVAQFSAVACTYPSCENMQTITPEDVLRFWFEETTQKQKFSKDEAFDKLIRDQFLELHASAKSGELWAWRETHEGRLAEVIVLDQFSRNMFRDTPAAFESDGLALVLAQEAVRAGVHLSVDKEWAPFILMPYMHSESKVVHTEADLLFGANSSPAVYDFEVKHKRVIENFGRYPHRNAILGRESTDAELQFLKEPDSSW